MPITTVSTPDPSLRQEATSTWKPIKVYPPAPVRRRVSRETLPVSPDGWKHSFEQHPLAWLAGAVALGLAMGWWVKR